MRRHTLPTLVGILVGTAVSLAAAPPRVLYERAQAREDAVRARLEAPKPGPSTLAEARRVAKSYERLALAYPASGYSDNALWQAGRLAADVWALGGDEADKLAALRWYRSLVKNFPTSSLRTKARAEIGRLDAAPALADARPAGPLPAAATTPKPRPAARVTAGSDERILPVPDTARVAVRDLTPPPVLPASVGDSSETAGLVRAITRTRLGSIDRVTIEFDGERPYHDERIPDPDRVFVDVRNVRVEREARRTQRFPDALVRQIRVGEPAHDTTRIVLDLDARAAHSVFTLYNPFRIVIDCERTAQDPPGLVASSRPRVALSRAPRLAPSRAGSRLLAAGTGVVATASVSGSDGTAATTGSVLTSAPDVPEPKAVVTSLPARSAPAAAAAAPALPSAPAANLQGRFSLSRQLGLGIARIVIDPGHGGHDPGAQSKGLNEADLVLDVALRLEQLLLKQPGVEVVLTRRTDVFIPLEERTALANREGADLFLSIHANASRNRNARGVETYFLNFASNPDAEAVAARENAASGRTMHSLPDIVKAITLNNKLDESRDFATMVQRSMVQRLRRSNKALRDLGVKQAPFVVLIGAGMPSVLAEISFVTHQQEGRLLKGSAYRQRIAEALFEGVAQYQRSLKSVQTLANQE